MNSEKNTPKHGNRLEETVHNKAYFDLADTVMTSIHRTSPSTGTIQKRQRKRGKSENERAKGKRKHKQNNEQSDIIRRRNDIHLYVTCVIAIMLYSFVFNT